MLLSAWCIPVPFEFYMQVFIVGENPIIPKYGMCCSYYCVNKWKSYSSLISRLVEFLYQNFWLKATKPHLNGETAIYWKETEDQLLDWQHRNPQTTALGYGRSHRAQPSDDMVTTVFRSLCPQSRLRFPGERICLAKCLPVQTQVGEEDSDGWNSMEQKGCSSEERRLLFLKGEMCCWADKSQQVFPVVTFLSSGMNAFWISHILLCPVTCSAYFWGKNE